MNQNNAAQPGLTDDQIETLAKKHIAPHYMRFLGKNTPYQQTEQFRRVKALIEDVLSKLRAPVADERVLPTLPVAWGSAINDAGDGHVDLYSAEQMQEYARAALASAPVAEPETMEEIHRQERERSPWKLPKDPTLPDCAPVIDESPMAKMAEALREKARQEQQAYQDRRNQATEWGPVPVGTEADDPSALSALADGLESIVGNENAKLAAAIIRRMASAPVADDWTPTPANINALPERVRAYIHDLVANADPSGMVAENTLLRDQTKQLDAMIGRLKQALNSVGGCFDAANCEGLPEALAETNDERLKDLVERRLMYANEYACSALAGAPVAGEATYYAVMHGQALFGIFETETAAGDCIAKALYPKVMSIRPLYTAPQASPVAGEAQPGYALVPIEPTKE